MNELEHQRIRLATIAWVERVVVGLDLCPFARTPLEAGRVRVAVTETDDPQELLTVVDDELTRLVAAEPAEIETTLIVHPNCLVEFADYNEFLDPAEQLLELRELDGVVQIASFHPEYCFADAEPDDPANCSNRSPYPMLHLLRERSVERAVDSHPDIGGIPSANVERLRALSIAQIRALWE